MPRYGWRYKQARKVLLAQIEWCEHGCGRRAVEADHQPPLSRHLHVEGSGCCELVASCAECARRQGGLLSVRPVRGVAAPVEPFDPGGFDVDSSVWDVAWLDDLREVPREGWWPRLMTVPHPLAVGSLGLEVVEWAARELAIVLRWWQILFLVRLLEHDRNGRLLWRNALLSVARQSGKSVLVYVLCEWRSEQHHRFDEDQLVLHTADTLESAREVQARAKDRAHRLGFKVREAAGELEIRKGPGHDDRWLVRSQSGVVGHSASLAVADEAHHVKLKTVSENLGPTTVEKRDSQLLLVSTAHSECTEVMPLRRLRALLELAEPDRLLIVEWSARWGTGVQDPVGARQASPFWHPDREAQIREDAAEAAMFEDAGPGRHDRVVGFSCQWHNIWPPDAGPKPKGVPLVDPELWAARMCDVDAEGPLVIGVEDRVGFGAAVAVCGLLPDGRWVVGGWLCESRDAAFTDAAMIATHREGSRMVVGADLKNEPRLAGLPVVGVQGMGRNETGPALAGFRDLLAAGQVVHDGTVSPSLEAQTLAARVVETVSGGLNLVPGERSDLLRAAVWALRIAHTTPTVTPAIYWPKVAQSG